MDIRKLLAYGRMPMFLGALMQVSCSKTYTISITLITFKLVHNDVSINPLIAE